MFRRAEKAERQSGDEKGQMNLFLPVSLIDRFRRIADRNRRPISAEAQIAFEAHLEREESPNGRRS